jgi:hypothetical protein
VKPTHIAGHSFYSPHNKGASLVFTQQNGMLFVSEMKMGKAIQPYQHLNCGIMTKLVGLSRGISCSVNPYGLEKGRKGSATIDFAVYADAKGRAAVSPLFDYEIAAWENSGADLMFHNWTQK